MPHQHHSSKMTQLETRQFCCWWQERPFRKQETTSARHRTVFASSSVAAAEIANGKIEILHSISCAGGKAKQLCRLRKRCNGQTVLLPFWAPLSLSLPFSCWHLFCRSHFIVPAQVCSQRFGTSLNNRYVFSKWCCCCYSFDLLVSCAFFISFASCKSDGGQIRMRLPQCSHYIYYYYYLAVDLTRLAPATSMSELARFVYAALWIMKPVCRLSRWLLVEQKIPRPPRTRVALCQSMQTDSQEDYCCKCYKSILKFYSNRPHRLLEVQNACELVSACVCVLSCAKLSSLLLQISKNELRLLCSSEHMRRW